MKRKNKKINESMDILSEKEKGLITECIIHCERHAQGIVNGLNSMSNYMNTDDFEAFTQMLIRMQEKSDIIKQKLDGIEELLLQSV